MPCLAFPEDDHDHNDDHDPIIASYSVHLTPSITLSPTSQKLLVLQYPAHRPADTPYNARNLQKPTSLRIKPTTGLVELDIPIDTKLNYNPHKGSEYATSLKRSRIIQENGTHGLGGGFNTGPVGRHIRQEDEVDINTIPAHSTSSHEPSLNVQTLGGKIVTPSPGDPIYMLGTFQNSSLHLSRLDALVQVRPELHHLDAADEFERIRNTAAFAQRAKGKDGGGVNGDITAPPLPTPTRPESKAIDIKLKSNGPHDNDISTNTNAKLLRAIQQEPWQTYEWIDEDESESHLMSTKALHLPDQQGDLGASPALESAISNSEWLDLMSAPRIDHGKKGDKGLMGKVRGRERERQRRKKNEVARRGRVATAKAAAAAAEVPDMSATAGDDDTVDDDQQGRAAGPSDEESSEDDGGGDERRRGRWSRDEEMADVSDMRPAAGQLDGIDDDEDEVEEVQGPGIAVPPAAARKRGRPRKSRAEDPILIDE